MARDGEGGGSIWAALDVRDRLFHHPFDDYDATVVRFFRDAAADPDVTAIVSTGYSDNPVVSEYRSYGFTSFLNKPYTIHSLKESLDSLLGCGEGQPAV